MQITSLLITTGVSFPIIVSYIAAARYLRREDSAKGRYGLTGKRRISPRNFGSKLHWIDAAELKRLVAADPELVVFHLIDDDPAEFRSRPFENEIALTFPQLQEALPWMPRGTSFAIYQAEGITPELAKRLSAITRGRKAMLLCGAFSPATDRPNRRIVREVCN